MDRDRLFNDMRWLAESNPKYAAAEEEERQNPAVARLMAEDLLLAYIDDGDVTDLFNAVRNNPPRQPSGA